MGSAAAFLTAYYSARLIYLTFMVSPNAKIQLFQNAHEAGARIGAPLLTLIIASIFIGFWGVGAPIPPFIPFIAKMGPLFLSLGGAIIGGLWGAPYSTYTFLNGAWYFNYIINHFAVFPLLNFAHLIAYRVIDCGLLEFIGPKGVTLLLVKYTQNISYYQSGMVYNYILVMAMFTALSLYGC